MISHRVTQTRPGETREASCLLCGGATTPFLDLGTQPLADRFRSPSDTSAEFTYHLEVGQCGDCSMVQMLHPIERELMFNEHYPYRTSLSSRMSEHFERTAHALVRRADGADPFIVEVGSNDGAVLRHLAVLQVRHLGFEPSSSVARPCADGGLEVIEAFFEERTARDVRERYGPADIIYAANTMCHIPYLGSVLTGADALLAEGGVLIFEDPYLGDIVRFNSFDQFYDEHCYLFSGTSIDVLARSYGFSLVDVERLPVHGGEVRYSLARLGEVAPARRVADLLAHERVHGLHSLDALHGLARRVDRNRRQLLSQLAHCRRQGLTVVGYGATAKSATVCNYVGIDTSMVSRVYDSTPGKQGLLTPGSGIPVVPSAEFGPPYPDVALLFAWNHAQEILERETAFTASGGRWLTYVPEVRLSRLGDVT